jgi:GAF domain-containing protein
MSSESRSLSPQQAFERLSALRLTEHSLDSAMQQVADLAKATIPGASEVSVTLVGDAKADTIVSTGQLAADLDESQYERGYGPCLDASSSGHVMVIDDMTTEARWSGFTQVALRAGARSVVSVPITLQAAPPVAVALNLYGNEAHAFDPLALRTANSFASHAESMLENMYAHHLAHELVQQLTQAMGTRPVIEQAKGILMRDKGCTDGEAFALLVAESHRTRRKLRDIAQEIVNSVVRRPSRDSATQP